SRSAAAAASSRRNEAAEARKAARLGPLSLVALCAPRRTSNAYAVCQPLKSALRNLTCMTSRVRRTVAPSLLAAEPWFELPHNPTPVTTHSNTAMTPNDAPKRAPTRTFSTRFISFLGRRQLRNQRPVQAPCSSHRHLSRIREPCRCAEGRRRPGLPRTRAE